MIDGVRGDERRSARRRVAALTPLGGAVPTPPPGPAGAPRAGPRDPPTQPLLLGMPAGHVGAWARRWLPAWLPGWLRTARLDPGRPGAVALALVTATAAVVAAVGVWRERPVAEPAPTVVGGPAPGGAGAESTAPSSASVGGVLVVSVMGKVARPGLVRVPDGARVADVLDAAGGALPGTDLAGLNLARRVADGEQLAVGVPQPPEPLAPPGQPAVGPAGPGSTGPAGPAAPAGKVDLNRATGEQLDALPGVGPVTAQRILDWRTQHGRFTRIEQLREIEGIGERRFAQLRALVTV